MTNTLVGIADIGVHASDDSIGPSNRQYAADCSDSTDYVSRLGLKCIDRKNLECN